MLHRSPFALPSLPVDLPSNFLFVFRHYLLFIVYNYYDWSRRCPNFDTVSSTLPCIRSLSQSSLKMISLVSLSSEFFSSSSRQRHRLNFYKLGFYKQLQLFHYKFRGVIECYLDWYFQLPFWYRWHSILYTGNSTCNSTTTAQEMKFSIKDFFSRIWSHLLKTSLMENFMFFAVHFPTKSNKQTAIVRGKYDRLWPNLPCFAGWWLFGSNMDHMPLRWHLFQLKLERVDESPGLSSCYQDIRDNHDNQLWLKKTAHCIFEGWLAHSHAGWRK